MAGSHVDELMAEHLLGTLAEPERALAANHLASCERCAVEQARTADALASLGWALAPLPPTPAVRSRLAARVRGTGRFTPFARRIARLFDLAADQAEGLLATLDEPANWVAGPPSAAELYFVPRGPRLADAEAGFVRFAPGAAFPRHEHLGEESTLVLAGALREEGGGVLRAGDEIVRPAGSVHSFVVLEEGCLFAVAVFGGVDFAPAGLPVRHVTRS